MCVSYTVSVRIGKECVVGVPAGMGSVALTKPVVKPMLTTTVWR